MQLNGLLLGFGLLIAGGLRAQGPVSGFLPARGRTDLALTASHEHFKHYFFGTERRRRSLDTRSVNLFAEHGFNDTSSLVFTGAYRHIDPVNRGLQDGTLAFKYRNRHAAGPWGESTFLTSVGLSFPLSGYRADTGSPIGVRATVFHGRILGQYQFPSGIFLHWQTGLDFRFIPTALTSVPLLGRVGWAGRRWFTEGWVEYYHTFSSAADTRVTGGAGSRWWRVGGTLYYGLGPALGIVVNASQFLRGRNIGQALLISGGAVVKI